MLVKWYRRGSSVSFLFKMTELGGVCGLLLWLSSVA